MARYNIHKRHTLDRLTQIYHLRMRAVIKSDLERQLHRIVEALDAGQKSFTPDVKGMRTPAERVLEDHRDRVIHVGVSDGIQEVTPDHELGLWERFPLTMPIEDTLSVNLARERDKIRDKIAGKWERGNQKKILPLASTLFEDYVSAVQKSYRIIAKDWIEGEGDQADVLEALKQAFVKTDNQARLIFQTETTNYFNDARHDYFSTKTSVDYIELYAVTDGRISQICEDRHTAVITIAEAGLKKYKPAFHPWCRTIQRPLLSYLSRDKLVIEKGVSYRERTEATWHPAAW